MGIFDRMKKAVRGPLRIEVSVAPTFSWSAESLPVTVSLTNESDETINVTEIEVELEKVVTSNTHPRGAGRKVKVQESFLIQPAETTVRTFSLPLSLSHEARATGADVKEKFEASGLPSWAANAAAKKFDSTPERPQLPGRHELEVEVKLASGRSLEKEVRIEAV